MRLAPVLSFGFVVQQLWRSKDRLAPPRPVVLSVDIGGEDCFVGWSERVREGLGLAREEVDPKFVGVCDYVAPSLSVAFGILGNQLLDPGLRHGDDALCLTLLELDLLIERSLERRFEIQRDWWPLALGPLRIAADPGLELELLGWTAGPDLILLRGRPPSSATIQTVELEPEHVVALELGARLEGGSLRAGLPNLRPSALGPPASSVGVAAALWAQTRPGRSGIGLPSDDPSMASPAATLGPGIQTLRLSARGCARQSATCWERFGVDPYRARMADGDDIPEGHQRGPRLVRLPALTVLKAELYRQLRETGITRAELSRRLGWKRESVDRLFRLDHFSRLEQLEAAFAALGRAVSVSVHAAARACGGVEPAPI